MVNMMSCPISPRKNLRLNGSRNIFPSLRFGKTLELTSGNVALSLRVIFEENCIEKLLLVQNQNWIMVQFEIEGSRYIFPSLRFGKTLELTSGNVALSLRVIFEENCIEK